MGSAGATVTQSEEEEELSKRCAAVWQQAHKAMNNDFTSPAHAAANPVSGPRRLHVEIDGAPYAGAHTRRALRAAMTRAGVETCTVNGVAGYNKASLAYFHELA